MNNEDKLFLNVDCVLTSNEKVKLLTRWETDFLRSVFNIYRKTNDYSTKGLTPKQKAMTFHILKSHGLIKQS
ncbi:hypothetical protein DTC83_25520 [Salmonella enterica]|nr:hypothetical protein [Salmonella enterica]